MPRGTRTSSHLVNTAQIFRESIRILQLHPTHFHSISMFLFSPLPISLFISHFLIRRFPDLPSPLIETAHRLLGQNRYLPLNQLLSKTILHIIICLPSSLTFSLLGRAATIQAVSDAYNRIQLDRRRILLRSGSAWVKLLHTSLWECIIVIFLFGALVACLATLPKIFFVFGICSRELGFWVVLGFLGAPFCVAFAHVMVVGNLARVLCVLENDCCGLHSLMKARRLLEGKRQTALVMALMSNVGFRLVECLLELRMCRGMMSLWEGPMLVSMYSLLLVLDTLMNAVFYYTCKPWDSNIL